MRLFLASQDLGDFAEVLQKMVGEKRRAFIISNARDYYQDETRIINILAKTFAGLEQIGIEAKRLDLRKYFGKQDELVQLIAEYDPGLIFSIGGNVYCLATALHESGMDEIIREGLAQDKFVYGGYSAGSMVATNNLSLYQVTDGSRRPPEITREVYGLEPVMHGLGIIPQYITPHVNRPDHIAVMRERLGNIKKAQAEAILLNDPDVYVVNGNKSEVLKGIESNG